MALMSFENFSDIVQRNQNNYNLYVDLLNEIDGVVVMQPNPDESNNYQYIVLTIDECDFGLSRDELMEILWMENVYCRRYFAPGAHRAGYYARHYPQYVDALPVTDKLSDVVLQLPSGQEVEEGKTRIICNIIFIAHKHSLKLCGLTR